jgi:hypothetical protein
MGCYMAIGSNKNIIVKFLWNNIFLCICEKNWHNESYAELQIGPNNGPYMHMLKVYTMLPQDNLA